MDTDLEIKAYVIIKGYIDARDEYGTSLFGTILSVASRRDIKYLSVMFSRDETSKTMEWDDLLFLHRDRGGERDRDPMMIHREEELFKYLHSGVVMSNVAKNRNPKQAEQSISRYCLEKLQLKAVSLIEYFEASDSDIALFESEGGAASGSSTGGAKPAGQANPDSAEPEPAPEAERENAPKVKEDLVVRCEPILAPVGGIAMNELSAGDIVMTRLPEDSVFFKLMSRNIRGFDGIVSASVTGILQNDLGTATISLALSEGITGVMKLSGKVRVKSAAAEREPAQGGASAPSGVILGAAFAIIVIAAALAAFFIFK